MTFLYHIAPVGQAPWPTSASVGLPLTARQHCRMGRESDGARHIGNARQNQALGTGHTFVNMSREYRA